MVLRVVVVVVDAEPLVLDAVVEILLLVVLTCAMVGTEETDAILRRINAVSRITLNLLSIPSAVSWNNFEKLWEVV